MSRAEYDLERYYKRRSEYIEKLGGKCIRCNSTDALEFDHIDAQSKSFDISSMMLRQKDMVDAEIAKCQLLCHSCHRTKSIDAGDVLPPTQHGSINMYRVYKCRCDLCKATWNAKTREWKAKAKLKRAERA